MVEPLCYAGQYSRNVHVHQISEHPQRIEGVSYGVVYLQFGRPFCGSIDFVAQDSEGRLVLFDWKRTKQIATKYNDPFRSMHEPLSHLDDCAGWHYRLQLNVYRYLLMKYYAFDVSAMYVVCTHPDNGETAFVDEVPVLEQEVNVLMNKQRQFVAEDTTSCQNERAHYGRGSSTVAATQLVPMDICVPVETSLTQPWVATGEVEGSAFSCGMCPGADEEPGPKRPKLDTPVKDKKRPSSEVVPTTGHETELRRVQ